MAIYLNENRLGRDDNCIGFPHLLVCMGIVLLTRGNMYGVHIAAPSTANQTIPQFGAFLTQQGVIPADMLMLYGCCNLNIRYHHAGNKKRAWRTELRHVAGVIGYQGNAKGFDTAIINPRDGTYVEYQRDVARERCRIFYKRNEKMQFTQAPGIVPEVFLVRQLGGGAIYNSPYGNEVAANVIPTASNQGQIHEVNYFLRLKSFTI